MSPLTYNIALATGVVLVGAGVALINIPAAFVTVGALVIGLTLFAALMSRS
ncbi:hypothetical protein ACS7SF_02835 [Ralstonia sp. 25C]|uniref:hypothetical protein n=1 Tax=Ralstonia sp. 25C TaxID=3447363 RepID=UPI003F7536D2